MYNIKYFTKKILPLLLVVIILFFTIFLAYKHLSILCSGIDCISLSSIDSWKEQEIYENSFSTYRALLLAPGYSIRVEKNLNLSEKDADTLILINVMKTKGLFDEAWNPYTGEVSNKISCENKYKPDIKTIIVNNVKITYYIGWLNNRLQYGACLDEQLTHRAYNALFYCSNQRALYHFEFIVAIKDKPDDSYFLNQIENIKCQNPLLKIGNILP